MSLYDIITLDNNKEYVISNAINYNGKEYLLLIRVDEQENLLNEKIIVEKINNNELKKIQNKNLEQIISEIFAKKIIQNLK